MRQLVPQVRARSRDLRSACARFLSISILSTMFLTSPARANGASVDVERLHIAHWTTEDGLPQSSVNAIEQTGDGYLWFGTFDGLARFNGVEHTVFDISNTEGLSGNRILAAIYGLERSVTASACFATAYLAPWPRLNSLLPL